MMLLLPALLLSCWAVSAMVMPSVTSQIRLAIDLTSKANLDPAYADDACKVWSSILDTSIDGNDVPLPLPLDAMSCAHALYASALVRIGRDKEAIIEYDHSLVFLKRCGMSDKQATKAEVDIRMGKGKSLQRRFRYREAMHVFMKVAERCVSEKMKPYRFDAVRRAALCSMRVGDVDAAINILEQVEQSQDPSIPGFLGTLLLLKSQKNTSDEKAYRLLQYASEESSSPIYKWLHYTSSKKEPNDRPFAVRLNKADDSILNFAEYNNSPFDDSDLLNLDDKILLHSVITSIPLSSKKGISPKGYVLPQELQLFSEECKTKLDKDGKKWMLKDRAGYGSHGNRIVSAREVISAYKTNNDNSEAVLCQQIVESPMLIDGRRFSLRIYVVYFPEGILPSVNGISRKEAEILLSSEGLVKLASVEYCDGNSESHDLDDQYMTNSGRGDGRTSQQYDLQFLREEFDKNNVSFDEVWKSIQISIQMVMERYLFLQSEQLSTNNSQSDDKNDTIFIHTTHRRISTIPKILGFDFILDSTHNVWLLEVNRFPGLEPRSSMDSAVKHAVIYDAWIAATDRLGLPRGVVDDIRPLDYGSYSLKRFHPIV